MSEYYPTRPGYFFRNGRWYPSKKTKRARREQRLNNEIGAEIIANPDKYTYTSFVTSRRAAEDHGLEVWWGKCKMGHLTERQVTQAGCPICDRVSRHVRDARINAGMVKLTKEEERRLHEIYEGARRLKRETGIEYHVDHKRPLAAGGSHHPDNLQILRAEENLAKGALHNGMRKTYSEKEKREIRKQFEAGIEERRAEACRAQEKREAREAAERRRERGIALAILGTIGLALWLYFNG